ncbi:UPF0287-domain-containing protein [Microstroma glucosiphilum]|uniref:COX assembly mitochondrial protein n=1 Tax=Pseudomicrostroma glucosiphilum TaxID=1684307 RepID=A0A316U6C8_9BASI|nr:UPF0287-domain-containing protein [Pseudomicrostroma glucosiphilum]PWN20378.1 UPF0287-domain-containing protein [Pseudomicrostroma glucosiphilum]
MHPHLVQGKQARCASLVHALEECHSAGLLPRLTGKCNDIKQQLNLCLREERIERTGRNAEKAKERQKEVKKVWSEIEQEG